MRTSTIDQVTIEGRRMPALVSTRAEQILAETRFTPYDLLRAHADPDKTLLGQDGVLETERLNSGGALVTAFSFAGSLVIWTVTSSDNTKTVVMLPSEVPQNTELFG